MWLPSSISPGTLVWVIFVCRQDIQFEVRKIKLKANKLKIYIYLHMFCWGEFLLCCTYKYLKWNSWRIPLVVPNGTSWCLSGPFPQPALTTQLSCKTKQFCWQKKTHSLQTKLHISFIVHTSIYIYLDQVWLFTKGKTDLSCIIQPFLYWLTLCFILGEVPLQIQSPPWGIFSISKVWKQHPQFRIDSTTNNFVYKLYFC